jgi:hypothetical protein
MPAPPMTLAHMPPLIPPKPPPMPLMPVAPIGWSAESSDPRTDEWSDVS